VETASRELLKYKLDFVRIQQVNWHNCGAETVDDFYLSMEMGELIFN
jgi:hypothetical protein